MGFIITKIEGLTNTSETDKLEPNALELLEMELFLEAIYRHYGFDFRNYSSSFMRRRILNRMRVENMKTISGLLELVLHNYSVMERLLADFSITVTEMFRDPDFFLEFREKVVPVLKEYPVIRIWHAGCSTGEEAYSMAILLHEEGLYSKTRIYATDFHENILNRAKQASFPLDRMQTYTKNYLAAGGTSAFSEYYTVNKNESVIFDPYLSKNIVFAHHDLATDRSFNEFHVIICRNVVIYFNKLLQNRVFELFYQSLSPRGFLGLGNKEDVKFSSCGQYLEKLNLKVKLFRKKI